ncbi:Lrp/AsnC family transcriptional regulator [Palleronia abyssalis]|uniref:Leucine-responsive regulatory protein n=1 Tax=Palleronia abyssalis TaxID=1501240 RepID=A0A2R8BVS8_9RHOB|nr:Lrp/AsnC family transcriptional regulator [Palleronia abyssalis]SPJ24278.1 Leucine-responsive regulatory protein [Palleronia abyssalis]
MDRIDENILRELSQDGRLSNLALSQRVGLSPSACLRRVQALEASGVIAGYRAVLDPGAMGRGFIAYLEVGLTDHTKVGQEGFERAVAASPEVVECYNVTGRTEYLLRVEVADIEAYKRFHTDVLGTLPQLGSIVTFVVLGAPKGPLQNGQKRHTP